MQIFFCQFCSNIMSLAYDTAKLSLRLILVGNSKEFCTKEKREMGLLEEVGSRKTFMRGRVFAFFLFALTWHLSFSLQSSKSGFYPVVDTICAYQCSCSLLHVPTLPWNWTLANMHGHYISNFQARSLKIYHAISHSPPLLGHTCKPFV